MGKCGGRRGSEALGKIWEENALFQFQRKSRLHGESLSVFRLLAPPANAWGPMTRLQVSPKLEDTVREQLVREGRHGSWPQRFPSLMGKIGRIPDPSSESRN